MEAVKHTASLNIPEGLLAQQDPGLMRKLPLLSPLLHPLFIIAFLIKHATTSFPILPRMQFLRHTPRRHLGKIKSQPTKRCLWYMQKQPPAVKNLAEPAGSRAGRAETWRCALWWGAEAGQSCRAPFQTRRETIPPQPWVLTHSLPCPAVL